ncbi:cat eye syndrome critical region protein [Diplocarpon rosae]|nr:cat eye syndrome critical region protein [Diplocarpon rosae]
MDHITPENCGLAQKFQQDRYDLASREKLQRSDHEFVQSLSPTATKACQIVSCIRLDEQNSIWSRTTPAKDSSLEAEELFPGMIFNSAKNHMKSTQLWRIVQKMPKGALLHCHLGATVELEWVFETAISTPGMVISASEALNDAESRERAVVKIEFSKSLEIGESSIWQGAYNTYAKIPLKTSAQTFPDGGKVGFLKWIKDRCSVTQTEAVQHHLGVDAIWRKLQAAFVLITPVVYYEPVTRKLIRRFLKTAYEDGIRWVEVRGMTRSFRLEGQEQLVENRLEIVRVYKEEIDRFVCGDPEIDLKAYHKLEDDLLRVVDRVQLESIPCFSDDFAAMVRFVCSHSDSLQKTVDDEAARVVEVRIFADLATLRPRYEQHMIPSVADSSVIQSAKKLLIRIFETLGSVQPAEKGKGRRFWGCRIIWDCLRSFDDAAILEDMKLCLQAKQLYPSIISGYDLVGPEDLGRTLQSLSPLLLWFQSQCRLLNLSIPFFFHAGECVGSGDTTDGNLYDALLLNSRRLGHAFSLYKHPLLIDLVKAKMVLVECCPISNEVLRYTASVKTHPLPALLARGVKASLSSDDPGMMGQGSGLSCDFWQALQGWDSLGLAGLGSLAQNSVRWSAFEDQSDDEWFADVSKPSGLREQRIQEWSAEWEAFCQWVVDEFGNGNWQQRTGH